MLALNLFWKKNLIFESLGFLWVSTSLLLGVSRIFHPASVIGQSKIGLTLKMAKFTLKEILGSKNTLVKQCD
jgi:hypothetical protein